jgi:chemotaxis protein MotB
VSGKGDKPIIIVKRRRGGGGGHHGGAWKVAYADFVTAMMAFFMVMWLVAAVDKQTRAAMFEYFKNPSMEEGKSVKAAPGQMGPGGASTAVINMGGGLDAMKPPLEPKPPDPEEAVKLAQQQEQAKLQQLMDDLKRAIEESETLKPFKDQLLLDITPEGLRIQIVDAQNRPMFDLGSSKLKDYTTVILKELTGYLNSVPNRLSLSGHTDITPFARAGFSNWDLSADRANAARRSLEAGGLNPDKIARIVGLSSSLLFDPDNPRDPVNRRISIIVMTKQAEEAAKKIDTVAETPAAPAPVDAAAAAAAAVGVADGIAAPAGAATAPAAVAPAGVATPPVATTPAEARTGAT